MSEQTSRAAWRFFHEHAGYIVGERAASALRLARAETWARDTGLRFTWEADDCNSWDDINSREWCAACRHLSGPCDKPYRFTDGCDHLGAHSHEVEVCVARYRDGRIAASLGGIVDADRDYRRVVEAELALEARAETIESARVSF